MFVAALMLSAQAHADWPTTPLPEGATGEWVSRHMVYNGLHMRVVRVRSEMDPEQFAEFYRAQWRDAFVEDDVDHLKIIGHATRTHYLSVDIAAHGGGTEANVAITRLPRPGERMSVPGEGFAKPANTLVLNDISHLDDGGTRTLAMSNTLSPSVNQDFYVHRFTAQGWRARPLGPCLAGASACAVEFEKAGAGTMSFTFHREPNVNTIVTVQVVGN